MAWEQVRLDGMDGWFDGGMNMVAVVGCVMVLDYRLLWDLRGIVVGITIRATNGPVDAGRTRKL